MEKGGAGALGNDKEGGKKWGAGCRLSGEKTGPRAERGQEVAEKRGEIEVSKGYEQTGNEHGLVGSSVWGKCLETVCDQKKVKSIWNISYHRLFT